jgi:hypothetical protein
MQHKFVILNNGVLETYTKYEDIPLQFDNVIEFKPWIDEEHEHEHDEHDHDELAEWNIKLQELIKRETK